VPADDRGKGIPARGSREPATPRAAWRALSLGQVQVKGRPANDDGERGKLSGSCPCRSEEIVGEYVLASTSRSGGWAAENEKAAKQALPIY
jgi:hypothetical protein